MVCLAWFPYALFGGVQVTECRGQHPGFCEAARRLLRRYLYDYVKYDHLKMFKK